MSDRPHRPRRIDPDAVAAILLGALLIYIAFWLGPELLLP